MMFTLAIASVLALQDATTHPWGKFKVGSWAKYESKSKAGDYEMPGTQETWTVKEVTADYVVVNSKSDLGDNDQKMPFKADGTHEFKDKGTETIEAAGKKYACEVKEMTTSGVTMTTWNSKEAPGGFVKATNTGNGNESTTILVATAEKVKVGDKEVTCWVTETTMKMAVGSTTSKMWSSAEVPGHSVKMETVSEFSGTKTISSRTLIGFETK